MFETIPKNTATATDRRITFVLRDETDLITPEDITVTGVKVSLSFAGGSTGNSTNDIVKVDGATGRYYIELTQSEANNVVGGISGYLKPTGCAAAYPQAFIGPSDVLTAAATTTEIADAVNEGALDIIETYNRSSNTSATITGPNGARTLTIVTDATYLPIESIS